GLQRGGPPAPGAAWAPPPRPRPAYPDPPAHPEKPPRRKPCSSTYGSSYRHEKSAESERCRPAPDLPGGRPIPDREVNDLGPSDNVVERHIPYFVEIAAVGGTVAVVAHHEIVSGRDGVDLGVVEIAVVKEVERREAPAVRQGLAPAFHADRVSRKLFGIDHVLKTLAFDRLAVEVQHAADHLHAIARNADDPLDQVGIALRQ